MKSCRMAQPNLQVRAFTLAEIGKTEVSTEATELDKKHTAMWALEEAALGQCFSSGDGEKWMDWRDM